MYVPHQVKMYQNLGIVSATTLNSDLYPNAPFLSSSLPLPWLLYCIVNYDAEVPGVKVMVARWL